MSSRARVALFLVSALVVHVAAKLPFVRVTPWWVGLYALVTALGLVAALFGAAAAFGGRAGLYAVLGLTWLQCVPLLPVAPPLEFEHSFDEVPRIQGSGVTILRETGWVQMRDGLGLPPGGSGELLLKVAAPRLRVLYLQPRVYSHWSVPFENRLEVSGDGATYRTLTRDATLAGMSWRLSGVGPSGRREIWLRFSARNPSSVPVLAVDHVKVYTGRLQESVLALLGLLGWLFVRFGARVGPLPRVARDVDELLTAQSP